MCLEDLSNMLLLIILVLSDDDLLEIKIAITK